jgi:RNA polymerase sigma factor (sigma-70 family)
MPIHPQDLEIVLDRYWPVLVEWIGGARGDAEDIVQSAFIKLAIEEPTPTHCVAWLFTVSKNIAMNERLSQAKRRVRESEVGTRRAASMQSDSRAALELQDMLNTLDQHEREVVIARVWGQLTFEELAILYQDSKASVWRTYQTGISKLRDAYKEGSNEQSS